MIIIFVYRYQSVYITYAIYFRYKLKIGIEDGTGVIVAIAFDDILDGVVRKKKNLINCKEIYICIE